MSCFYDGGTSDGLRGHGNAVVPDDGVPAKSDLQERKNRGGLWDRTTR
jgi:hypothetical protein